MSAGLHFRNLILGIYSSRITSMSKYHLHEYHEYIFALNSDIINFLLRTSVRRYTKPNFVIFVVWSTYIVSGCVVEQAGSFLCRAR